MIKPYIINRLDVIITKSTFQMQSSVEPCERRMAFLPPEMSHQTCPDYLRKEDL